MSLANGIIPDPWLATSVAVPANRCGPPGTANGGWVSGIVAGHLGSGPIEVRLLAPTPLDTTLDLRAADDDATLSQGDELLVVARRSPGVVRPPGPVDWDEAAAASARFYGHRDHPFPGCFSCGTDRAHGDGLRLFPGPVADGPDRLAAIFSPQPAHAGPHGRLPAAAVWAALDCPTAWVNMRAGGVYLLGRMRAEVSGELRPGEEYLVVAQSGGTKGRKAYGRAAVYHRDGRVLAASEATWVRVGDPGAGMPG